MGGLILVLVVAGVVYFIASAKSRRDKAVETRIKKMVSSGVSSTTFSDLFYEAAKAYAISKGARAANHESASSKVVIDGHVYSVVFIRDSGGGTIINAKRNNDT